jgi:hypothetical protein
MASPVEGSGLDVGDTVKYVGHVAKNKIGKLATIVRRKGEYGFYLKYEDEETLRSATPEALQLVRKGPRGADGGADDPDACSTAPPRSTDHLAQAAGSQLDSPSSRRIPDDEDLAMRPELPCGENNIEQWTFCSPDAIDYEGVFRLWTNGVIRLDRVEFDKVYRHFRRSFAQKTGRPKDALVKDFIHWPLSSVNRELLPAAGMSGVKLPGIDLPCWIGVAQSDRRIILLGQESLRSDKFFCGATADSAPCVSIGTPYGVHSRALWKYNHCPRYWEIICYLLRAGYSIYLTDAFKFWYKNVTYNAAEVVGRTYRNILKQEFEVIKGSGPETLVVVFGQRVAEFLDPGRDSLARGSISKTRAEICDVHGMRMLRVLHPSPRVPQEVLTQFLDINGVDSNAGVEGIGKVIEVRATSSSGQS